MCGQWAAIGECEANPGWMLGNCRQSCGVCSSPAPPAPAPLSIVDTAVGNGGFTVLVEALQTAGLVDALSGPGPFTVFAPTDAAFTALLEALSVTKEELLARTDLAATQDVTTLTGDSLTVTSDGTTVMAGPATVVIADVQCSNGVIHVIDAVLLPPAAPAPPPSPCSDDNQMCNDWAANGECQNNPGYMLEFCRQSCGVCSSPTTLAPTPAPAPAPLSIVDTAVGNGAFTVLVEALQTAGLVDALSGPGPFTVFAPTDTAFSALLDAL